MEMVSQRRTKLLRAYAICKYITAIRTSCSQLAQPWPGPSKIDTDFTCVPQTQAERLPKIRQCCYRSVSNSSSHEATTVPLKLAALEQTAALVEGKVTPRLAGLLDSIKDEKKVSLAVADPKLGTITFFQWILRAKG